MGYFRNVWKNVLDSFKIGIDFAYVLLFELLFFLIIGFMTFGWSKIFNTIGRTGLSTNLYAANEAATTALRTFFIQSVSAVIAFVICLGILYVLFQALAWATIMHSKPRFARFALNNLGWLVCWAVVGWFITAGLKETFVVIGMSILLGIFLHLTNLFQHALLTQKDGFKYAAGFAFSTGVGKIHLFLLPYLFAVIVFLLWSQVWRIVPVTSTGGFAAIAVLCVIIAPFLAWYKFYLHGLLKVIEN